MLTINGTSITFLLKWIDILSKSTKATKVNMLGLYSEKTSVKRYSIKKEHIAILKILFDIVKPNMDEYGYPRTSFRFCVSEDVREIKDSNWAAREYLKIVREVLTGGMS